VYSEVHKNVLVFLLTDSSATW